MIKLVFIFEKGAPALSVFLRMASLKSSEEVLQSFSSKLFFMFLAILCTVVLFARSLAVTIELKIELTRKKHNKKVCY